jgi:hypothetical protein
MQYLLLIYDNEKIWNDMPKEESQKLFGEYMQFTADIKKSGHFVAGDALQPISTATTVRIRNGKSQVTDGPFAETKEQLGGYYLINAKDLDEARKIAERIPSVRFGSIEIRPVMQYESPGMGQ